MPRIPTREDYGSTPGVLNVPTPSIQPMPQVAAGEQVGAAVDRFGQVVQNLGGRLAEHAIKRQQEENESLALAADQDYRARLLAITSDPKNGLTNRELDAAKGLTSEFNTRETQARKEVLEGIKSPAVQALATGMFSRTREPYYSNIIQHEGVQTRAAYDKANTAAVENTVADADLFTTPAELMGSVNKAVAINTTFLTNKGTPPEAIKQANAKVIQKALESAIGKRVESNPAQARAVLDSVRAQVDPAIVADVEKTLEGKFTSLQAADLWRGPAQQFRRADGSYDTVALRAFVDAQPDMSQDKKDKIFSDLNGRASQNESNYKQNQANDQLAAMNEAIKLQKEGVPIEDIKKRVVGGHAAFGAKYQYDLERYIDGLFDTKRSRNFNDNSAYVKAYQKVTSGEWSLDKLNEVRDSLTQGHYDQLMRDYVNHINNPYLSLKQAHDEVNQLMDKYIGSGKYKKDERDRFISLLAESVSGRTDVTNDVYIQLAIDKLKQVKTGGKSWVLWDREAPQYQVENPDPGTPEYKAVQHLRAANEMLRSRGEKLIDITPAAIKTTISRNPDWTKK